MDAADNIILFFLKRHWGAAPEQPFREVFFPDKLFPASLSGLLLGSLCVSLQPCSEVASYTFADMS